MLNNLRSEYNFTYPEFIVIGENIVPGIRPSIHRTRTLDQIVTLFGYQRKYLFKRHDQHVVRINQMFRNWDDPFCRDLSVTWTEKHSRFYQPQQRVLFGLFLSAARLLGARSILINYERLITQEPIMVNDVPLALFLAHTFFHTPLHWTSMDSNFAKLADPTWFNFRHRGQYDLANPELFVYVPKWAAFIPLAEDQRGFRRLR